MLVYTIRRLLQAALVMVVMSALVFVGIYLIGDPIAVMTSPDATELERDAVRHALGLDQPLWRQYLAFVVNALHGDFGKSFLAGEPAIGLILGRMTATLELALVAIGLSVLVGLPLGVYAGVKPNSVGTRAIMTGTMFGFSLPNFWVGLMLIVVFAVYAGWLPSGGRGATVAFLGLQLSILTLDGWAHLILPAVTIAFAKGALIARVARATAREILPLDFIKFARAKGVSERRVISVHLLKNITIPVVTVTGLELGQVIAFAVVTETVFSWPGMGKLLIDSILRLDRPVVVAYLMVISIFLVLLNLAVDLLYAVLDPRVRLEGSSG